MALNCKYCPNAAKQFVVWLKDKRGRPAEIKLPHCGCDLMVALKRFWTNPYQITEGIDYRIESL